MEFKRIIRPNIFKACKTCPLAKAAIEEAGQFAISRSVYRPSVRVECTFDIPPTDKVTVYAETKGFSQKCGRVYHKEHLESDEPLICPGLRALNEKSSDGN